MSRAYDQIAPVMKQFLRATEAFHAVARTLGEIPETTVGCPIWQSFSECSIGFSEQRVLSWSIEVTARQAMTTARWQFELQLEHADHECRLSAEAGFLGKFGPMATRTVPDVTVSTLDELPESVDAMLRELFGSLAPDIEDAIREDAAERGRLDEARKRTG